VVKIETDSIDAMEMQTEANSSDITECSRFCDDIYSAVCLCGVSHIWCSFAFDSYIIH